MKILARMGMKEGDSIEHPWLSKSVERAQRKVEERNFQIRKNILEYDEVMEHQRQRFYGLRQRVLEGRDTRGLIVEYLREAVDDAVAEYLDKNYPLRCVSEFARQRLDATVDPSHLRNKELHEMEKRIKEEAKAEVRSMIDVTLGEFIPIEGSEIKVDFDAQGLSNWARSRFGVELTPSELESADASGSRSHVRRVLTEAAERRIDDTDISGIAVYLEPNYGPIQLVDWVKSKFDLEIPLDEILRAQDSKETTPAMVVMRRVRELYAKREADYPVEFAMDLTMMFMRQNPQAAAQYLVNWANTRLGLDWTVDHLRTNPPAKVREQLAAAARSVDFDRRLEEEIRAAEALPDDEALEKHLREKFNVGMTDWMRHLEGQERSDAIRARISGIIRAELVQFEQALLLHILDDLWRGHLHEMDRLRDVINFRAYSQDDPRIAFKREGAQQFNRMMQDVRDRLTDDFFKVRISPAPMSMPAAAPAPAMAAAPPMGAAPVAPLPRPIPAAMPPRPAPANGGGDNSYYTGYTPPAQPAPQASGESGGPTAV
jgi:preprotein translocase subunit SecA